MLTAKGFRRIALGMKDAVESAHMGHPDFRNSRNRGKIFATLADQDVGVVKLTPEQQEEFVREHSIAFVPASGAWGRQGWTRVRLETADEDTVEQAMTLAWQNSAVKSAASRPKVGRAARRIPGLRKS